jgi:NADPH2:quinone reductase
MNDFLGKRALVTRLSNTRENAIDNGVDLVKVVGPRLTELKPTDVVVEIRSASVSFIDLIMLTGQYHHKPQLPYTPGLEYSGVVKWAGSGVASLKEGDRVLSDFLFTGPRSSGRYERYGGWAELAAAPQDGLIRVPDEQTFDSACNLLLNYETAHFALVTRACLEQGETVLVTGATGAAGLAAVQVAKILGANVIATGRSAEKLKAATTLGADHTVDLTALKLEAGQTLRDRIKALTDGRGADVVFDTVGGPGLTEVLRCLSFGGRMAIVGWADNTNFGGDRGIGGSFSPDLIPTNLIQLKNLTIMGSPMIIASRRDPKSREERQTVILNWLKRGLITPYVSSVFPLEKLKDAMKARLSGSVAGACVLNPRSID